MEYGRRVKSIITPVQCLYRAGRSSAYYTRLPIHLHHSKEATVSRIIAVAWSTDGATAAEDLL